MRRAKMIDYLNLKTSYISALQMGLMLNSDYEEAKRGNDILHKLCENCVDNSDYSEAEKKNMKSDLKLIKEVLAQEIERHFHLSP